MHCSPRHLSKRLLHHLLLDILISVVKTVVEVTSAILFRSDKGEILNFDRHLECCRLLVSAYFVLRPSSRTCDLVVQIALHVDYCTQVLVA